MGAFFPAPKPTSQFVMPALLFLVVFYSVHQMLTGDRGLMAWYEISQQVEELRMENAALSAKREIMHGRVSKLRDSSLDVDYMDEMVRRMLPVSKRGEEIIILPHQ